MGFFDFLDKWAEKAREDAAKRKLEVDKRKTAREEEFYRQKLIASYEFEKPDLLRIISESVKIIETTKNLKTALGWFDLIRNNYGRLLARNPNSSSVNISAGKWIAPQEVTTHAEIMICMETAKKDYTRDFFKVKIDAELLKAESLSDKKLKKAQLKKALKAALDGLVYLPNEGEIKGLIATIEAQVASV